VRDLLPDRYVLNVGVRRPHKNQATIVRAIARLRGLRPAVHLVLVGDRDERFPDPIPRFVEDLGVEDLVVRLAGVDDASLLLLYGGAAAFAFPSLMEGFGLPILEAMAAGTPVVASDVPAVAETAAGGARLVPPLDVDAWADAIREIVTTPEVAIDLRRRGRAVASAWTWDDAGRQLLGILDAAAVSTGKRARNGGHRAPRDRASASAEPRASRNRRGW
jgi:glycosyltransferase involved in cell wall biosynthesis